MVTDVTGASSVIVTDTPHSEYPVKNWLPLESHDELISDSEAVMIDGIGCLAQYHCWTDLLYSHGFIYYLRDSLVKEIEQSTKPDDEIGAMLKRLRSLCEKITIYEQSK